MTYSPHKSASDERGGSRRRNEVLGVSLSPHHLARLFSFWLWASQVALVVTNLPANAGDVRDAGLIPGSGRSPGGENGNPFQHSCLENPNDRGARRATVLGVTQSRTRLSTHAWSGGPLRQYTRPHGSACFNAGQVGEGQQTQGRSVLSGNPGPKRSRWNICLFIV